MKDQSLPAIAWRQRFMTGLRIVSGGFCAYDASQKWQPGFHSMYLSALKQASNNQLPPVRVWFSSWFALVHTNIHAFTYSISILEFVLALCLLCGVLTRPVCGLGMLLALLGGISTGSVHSLGTTGSLDYGMMMIFLLLFLGLLLGNAGRPWGVDAWLNRTRGSASPAAEVTIIPFRSARRPVYPSMEQNVMQLASRKRAQMMPHRPDSTQKRRISSM